MRPQYVSLAAAASKVVPLDVNNDGFLVSVMAPEATVEITLDNVYTPGVVPVWTPAPAAVNGITSIERVAFALRITNNGGASMTAVVLQAETLRRRKVVVSGGPVYQDPALKQKGSAMRQPGSDPTGTSTFSQAVAAGSYLMVIIASYISTVDTVAGSVNGAFTKVLDVMNGGDNRMTVWVRPNAIAAAAGAEVITATPAVPGNALMSGLACEFTGVAAPDKSSYTVGSLSSVNAQDNATPKALVITGILGNTDGTDVITNPTGYTQLDQDTNAASSTSHVFSFKVVTATEKSSSFGATGTNAANTYDTAVLTFTAAVQP